MIRRKTEDGWLLFTQPDHAQLAGELAAHWGNEDFSRPEPREDVLLAVAEHDNGWQELDETPKFNPESGLPYHFAEWPLTKHFDTWRRAEKRFLDQSPYASILISRHGSTLFRHLVDKEAEARLAHPFFVLREWRDRGEKLSQEDQRKVLAFVEEREEFQARAMDILAAKKFPSSALNPDRLNENFRLLQTGDSFSLYATLGPPTERVLPGICRRGWSDPVDITLSPVGPNAAVVDPYPFSIDPLRLEIAGRNLPAGPFPDASALEQTWEDASITQFSFEFASSK